MEIRKNHGFILKDSKNLTQNVHDDIRGSICQICDAVKYATQNESNVPSFVLTFPLSFELNKTGVVHLYNNTTYFYTYDGHSLSNEDISNTFYSFTAVTPSSGSVIANRCYNFTKMFLKGTMSQEQIADNNVLQLIKEREQFLLKFQSKEITQAELHSFAQTYFNDEAYSLTIASHPKTHPKTLYALAHSPFTDVKIEVAKNPNATAQILNHLLSVPEAVPYVMRHPNYLNAPPTLTM